MKPVRWVLDTNVLVSALLFPSGRVIWLRDAWRNAVVVPLASADTTTELIRVLHYPRFGLDTRDREDILADYLPYCETVVVSPAPAVPACRDPFDRPFLELALFADADALVTGDHDLLAIGPSFSIAILSPATARDWLAGSG